MPAPSVRLLSAAVWALLDGHPQLQVFESIATNPDVDPDTSLLTRGYAVFHPGAGDDAPDNLAVTPGRLLWSFQVSCVGQDHDQYGWVIDTVRSLLTGKSLSVAGATVGRMQPPVGFLPPPPRPQFQASTERLMVPLQYVVLAVST